MIKTGHFLIKQITQKNTIINLNFFSGIMLEHTFSWSYEHSVVIGCKNTFYFKLMLQISEIDIHLPHPH